MARRVVPIVIDPEMEKPEERTGFTYPDLLSWCVTIDAELVTAAITVMLAYAQAGWPQQTTQSYGSFERWYERICGALMWAGQPDPCDGRRALAGRGGRRTPQFPTACAVLVRLLPRDTQYPTDPQAGGI